MWKTSLCFERQYANEAMSQNSPSKISFYKAISQKQFFLKHSTEINCAKKIKNNIRQNPFRENVPWEIFNFSNLVWLRLVYSRLIYLWKNVFSFIIFHGRTHIYGSYGFRWVFNGFRWVFMGFDGFLMDSDGFLIGFLIGFLMGFDGVQWVLIGKRDPVWLIRVFLM